MIHVNEQWSVELVGKGMRGGKRKDGHSTREVAPLKKSICSLIDLREILAGNNPRYLEFLSALDDNAAGEHDPAN